MANSSETFVLVELETTSPGVVSHDAAIKRVIRTYLSRSRADEDFDLLNESGPGGYKVIDAPHIDN